jgi:hypothetical protein
LKYVILIFHNPHSQQIWNEFSAEQRAEGLKLYASINDDLASSGELIATEALADPYHAKRVTVREAHTTATDGPFPEVKEHLAGFYLVDCESMERAIEIASRIPEAGLGLVEVRPVMSLSDFELGNM